MASEPLQQRVRERRVYEEIVNIVVDYVAKEFSDEESRLRIYFTIAQNFAGMANVLSNQPLSSIFISTEEDGEDLDE